MILKTLKYLLRSAYNKIGLNTANDGTIIFWLHKTLRLFYFFIRTPLALFSKKEISNIAIIMRGGIGDHLIASRFLRDLFAYIGPQQFDLYCGRGFCGKWIFGNNPQVTGIYDERLINENNAPYDVIIDISQFARVYLHNAANSSKKWGHLHKLSEKHYHEFKLEIDNFPFLDSHQAAKLALLDVKRYRSAHYFLELPYGGHRLDIPVAAPGCFDASQFPYITVHNGFDKTLATPTASSTKTYPHYDKVVKLIKVAFPNLKIVQIGVAETSTPIRGVDISLLDKTTLSESAYIIKSALLHIDNESGLVHLASCLETKACVLFGPTAIKFFGYESNINLKSGICGNCWWLTSTWIEKCPRNEKIPSCLDQLKPETVFEAVAPYIRDTLEEERQSKVPLPSNHVSMADEALNPHST